MAESFRQKWKKKNPVIRLLAWVCLVFLIYSLFGFFAVPTLIIKFLPEKLAEQLHRPVRIEKVLFNPYKLQLEVIGFSVQDKGNEEKVLCRFKSFFVDLESLSLLKFALIIREIRLQGPEINIIRLDANSYNISDLLTGGAPSDNSAAEEEKQRSFHFSLNNISISEAAITFDDRPKKTIHHITEGALAIPLVSNLDFHLDSHVVPAFNAMVNGAPVGIGGRSKPFKQGRPSEVSFSLQQVNLVEYLSYLPVALPLSLRSGVLTEGNASIILHLGGEQKPFLEVQGDVAFSDIDIVDEEQTSYATVKRCNISLLPSKVLEGEVHLQSISVEQPVLHVVRTGGGKLLPVDLFDRQTGDQKEAAPVSEESKTTFDLHVDAISLSEGKLLFADDSQAQPFRTILSPLSLELNNLALNSKEGKGMYSFSASSDGGEILQLDGTFSLYPLRLSGQVGLSGVPVNRYYPYYVDFLKAKIEEGSFDFSTTFDFVFDQTPQMLLKTPAFNLSDLRISEPEYDTVPIQLSVLAVEGGEVDLTRKTAKIAKIQGQGKVALQFAENGSINFDALLKKNSLQTVGVESGLELVETAIEKNDKWVIGVGQFELQPFSVSILDLRQEMPARFEVEPLAILVTDFSTEEEKQANLKIKTALNKKTKVTIEGKFLPEPIGADLAIGIDDFYPQDLQPYVGELLNLVIARGIADANCTLKLAASKGKSSQQTIGNCTISLSDLLINHAQSGEPFVALKDLTVKDLDIANPPLNVAIEKIFFNDWSAEFEVTEDGKLNVGSLLRNKESSEEGKTIPAAEKQGAEEGRGEQKIAINSVVLQNGSIVFVDHSIVPAYRTAIGQLSGEIEGLSSSPQSTAKMAMSGKMDGQAPLTIDGTINPLSEEVFADLTVDFKNIEMSPFSPYTGKYIGYKAQKGKLHLDLHYLVEGKEIAAQNKVLFDQFTLGESVESPDAVNLPIQLAMALLRNRKGEINLDIPVSGNLDDPDFSVAGVVFQVIFNLIAKAATSPFALLGALLPEGADMQQVLFSPGSSVIQDDAKENLEQIAKVLYERPGLRMDIATSVDYEAEVRALHEQKFTRLLQQMKYQKISRKEKVSEASADLSISKEEYPQVLEAAYKAATFEKPKNFIGLEKSMPVPEMEQMLRAHIEVAPDDLRLLALERANKVRDILVEKGPVEAQRIFVIEPDLKQASSTASEAESKVVMTIK